MKKMINASSLMQVDASFEESGGQIYRLSLCLAAILQKPLRIFNIRNKRPKPGLSKQHLTLTHLISYITNAYVTNDFVGSTDLSFIPNIGKSELPLKITKDVGSAGALSLVIQGLLPCMILLPAMCSKSKQTSLHSSSSIMELSLIGGTNVSHSPPIDHLQHILLPILGLIGIQSELSITRRGFYPKGQGQICLHVNSMDMIKPFDFSERGVITGVKVFLCGNGIYHVSESSDTAVISNTFYNQFKDDLLQELTLFLQERGLDRALSYLLEKGKDIYKDSPGDISYLHNNAHQSNNESNNHTKYPHSKTVFRSQRSSDSCKQPNSSFSVQICLITSSGIPISANILIETKENKVTDVMQIIRNLLAQLAHVVDSGACFDEYTADQLIVYMALATTYSNYTHQGNKEHHTPIHPCTILCAPKVTALHPEQQGDTTSCLQSSLHLESAMHIANLFTGCRFSIKLNSMGCRLITASMI